MLNVFFGKLFRGVVFLLALVLVFTMQLSVTQAQGNRDDEPLLADLSTGGAQLFNTINKGVIQIARGGELGGVASYGSGYVFDKEGYAISNYHVTGSQTSFEITFWGEQEKSRKLGYRHQGTLIGYDPGLDMAVIRVQAPNEKFRPVKLGDSSLMEVGDVVATCGSPGGDANAYRWVDPSDPVQGGLEFFNINLGVLKEILPFEMAFFLAHMGRELATEHYGYALQYVFHIDAAINAGNSGGPCFNAYGEAVGTNTWRLFTGENVGLSVPTNLLKDAAADIIAYGHVRRPWVGIALHRENDWSKADELRLAGVFDSQDLYFDPRPDELKICVVNPYSPAYEAGLREGDIIELVDGRKMDYIFDIYSYFLNAKIGQVIEFKLRRAGNVPVAVAVTVDEKKVRYFGSEIIGQSYLGENASFRLFHSPLTY